MNFGRRKQNYLRVHDQQTIYTAISKEFANIKQILAY